MRKKIFNRWFSYGEDTTSDPSDPPQSDSEALLQRKLLAFRTISAMLQYIPEEEPYEVTASAKLDGLERRHLRILTAFATLSVTDTEVITIAVKIDPTVLEIIATTQVSDDQVPLTPPPPPAKAKGFCERWRALFSGNAPGTVDNHESQPEIPQIVKFIDVGTPDNLATAKDIENYVNSCEAGGAVPPLATHLYIIKELLQMKKPGVKDSDNIAIVGRLLKTYIISACHGKIRGRLEHKTLALPLLQSLHKVPKPIKFNQAIMEPATSSERQCDKEVLTFVADTLSMVISLTPTGAAVPVTFTQLLIEAEKAKRGEPFELYNEETCNEFHALFLWYLNNFQASLESLGQHSCLSQNNPPVDHDYESRSVMVAFFATRLQYFIHGSALKNHLKTIELSLLEYYTYHLGFKKEMHLPTMSMATEVGEEQNKEHAIEAQAEDEEQAIEAQAEDKGKGREQDGKQSDEKDDEQSDEKDDEQDDQLKAVQPNVVAGGSTLPLWVSFQKWLELIVVHFDAVDLLVHYFSDFSNSQCDIHMRILEAPPVEKHAMLLPWQDLFTDTTLFPLADANFLTDGISNADLLVKFTQIPSNLLHTVNGQLKGTRRALHNGIYNKALGLLLEVTRSKSFNILKPWSDTAAKICEDYANATFPSSDKEATAAQLSSLRKFAHDVESLCDSMSYLTSLQEEMRFFLGTVHCEAILASFLCVPDDKIPKLDANRSIYNDMQHFSNIIGVSKNCCPVCQHLLKLLSDDHSGPNASKSYYIVRGSHKTVTACSLPLWLPEHIVDSMNQHFWLQLRKKLVKFHSVALQGHPGSTGSHGIDSQETDGPIINGVDEDAKENAIAYWVRRMQVAI